MSRMSYFLIVLCAILFFSCGKDKEEAMPETKFKKYLHLSHTRTSENPLMDSVAESLNFNSYDMLWLGGDLAFLTSADDATMTRTDSVYDLGSSSTLWALGNHDYTNLDRVEFYTKKPPFYTLHRDGITFVVLDTQDSLSTMVGAQKEMLFGVLDTIHASSHLVLLHHKLIWMYDNPILEPQISSVSNGDFGSCFYCINPNNFNSEIYPKLVEVKERGLEVLCVAGDIGFRTNEFEYQTPEGVFFLASGIESGNDNNKVLLFEHNPTTKSLLWKFVRLDDL